MRSPYQAAMVCLLVLAAAAVSTGLPDAAVAEPAAPELGRSTVEAFHHYVQLTDARNEVELKRGTGLLWVDGLPETERTQAYEDLKSGDVKMRKLETLQNGSAIPCPRGMIHHWVGLAFIPGVKLPDVLGVLQDYNQHAVYYAPDVERSKIE